MVCEITNVVWKIQSRAFPHVRLKRIDGDELECFSKELAERHLNARIESGKLDMYKWCIVSEEVW